MVRNPGGRTAMAKQHFAVFLKWSSAWIWD
jgi:hypothetical protein